MHNETEIFRELAPLLQVRPELQQICRFGLQWRSVHRPEPDEWAPFHIVTFGACLLDVGDRVGILLRAGDAAVLPHGGPHIVRSLPSARGPNSVERVHRRLFDEILVRSNVDGEPDAKLICGRPRARSRLDSGGSSMQFETNSKKTDSAPRASRRPWSVRS